MDHKDEIRQQAVSAREAGRQLQNLTSEQRTTLLNAIADKIVAHTDDILAANQKDVEEANEKGISQVLKDRLKLNAGKINTLAAGLRMIASQQEPIGKMVRKTELADGLVLRQVTCPIGVLLVIFESRPDVLPQVVALSIRSGNGLLVKGGKEAENSNTLLHSLIVQTIEEATGGAVSGSLVGLVHTRNQIDELLKLHNVIDLVIPRGSGQLVSYIQEHTKIPVMGHAEGICHVYVDATINLDKAIRVVRDSKTDYPSACNAAETLLLHRALVQNGQAQAILTALTQAHVQLYAGPKAVAAGFDYPPVASFHHEYSDLAMSVEVVDDVAEAIHHIHQYGSSHTESVVTEDAHVAQRFLQEVDSACVFHNASTRFADGFRFGLGAEVGISTGRIHARGPVGVEGLLTTRWILSSQSEEGHIVAPFSKGQQHYTHRSLPLQ